MGTFGRPGGQHDAVMRPNRADGPWAFRFVHTLASSREFFLLSTQLEALACGHRYEDSTMYYFVCVNREKVLSDAAHYVS